ncbi:MAG: hypothetical protein AAFZ07_12220 [Actinomycetota bacterium]
MSVLLNAGGLVVEIDGASEHVEVVRERLGSIRAAGVERDVRLSIETGSAHLPDREADATAADADLWWGDERLELTWCGVAARIEASTVVITVPADRADEAETYDAIDRLTQYGIAAAVVGPQRALVHGAAFARCDRALVVVGSSGAGKSTLAAAAWQHGWSLLGDDLVVTRRQGEELTARGVLRPPLVPDGSVPAGTGTPVPDDRARRRLSPDVLSSAELPVAGIVVADHDGGPGRVDEIAAADRVPALLHGLAVPPVPPVLAAHLPMLAALGGLPVHRLGHSADPDDRVERAAELLDGIGRRVGA